MESRVEEIMDSKLNSLPDDIIYKILSTVPMKDVIKTSRLSSRWRYVWTSMPCLNFLFDMQVIYCYFPYFIKCFDKFTQFVKNVMSHRNNQVPLSSVKLNIHGDVPHQDIEILIKYILSHNVQQVDVGCMVLHSLQDRENVDSELPVTPFSSQSLKRLSLTMEHRLSQYLTASSTLELPALTTLYLSHIELYGEANTLFSMCPNLKNLTLKSCNMNGSDSSISICHYQLSNLTLEHDFYGAKVVNVDAPQLQNLTIRYRFKDFKSYYPHNTSIDCLHEYKHLISAHPHDTSTYYRDCLHEYNHMISAPNLISLTYEGYDPLPLSTDGFHSLEKVDLCICSISQEATEALGIVRLFQQIQSVKFLKLNLEILELLSSHVQVISHEPPPFANLKSLDINPKIVNAEITPKEIVNIYTEVKNYLLDSSQGATFTMVSRQEAIANMKATQASARMADLKRFLDEQKDIIETMANRNHMQQPTDSMYNDDDNGEPNTQMQVQIRKDTKQINSWWIDYEELTGQGKLIVIGITSYLNDIESVLTKLPASKRAMLQPSFLSLCAESDIFISKMTERIKIHSEYLNNASDRFHELVTSL